MKKSYLNNKVIVNEIKEIHTLNSQIFKFMNINDDEYYGFGELYGSIVKSIYLQNSVKSSAGFILFLRASLLIALINS